MLLLLSCLAALLRAPCGSTGRSGTFKVLFARPVKAKEIASDAAAKAAMDAEWASLRAMKTWEEDKVREWSDVREEARRTDTRNHVGMVFGVCVDLSCREETPAENSRGAASFEATPSEMRTTTLRYSKIWDHRPQACRRPKSLTSSACCRDAALCWRTPSERIAKHCLSEYQRGSGCRAIDGRLPGAKCTTPLCHYAWPCTDTLTQEHAGKSTAMPN